MRGSFYLLLVWLLLLSMGASQTTTVVGCGSAGVGSSATFGCSKGNGRDPCDYIVTVRVIVLLDTDSSPLEGATVTILTGPADTLNTMVTDSSGQVLWEDTSFLTGFSARCEGRDVGTVQPYEEDTSFTWSILVSYAGLATAETTFRIDRQSRDIEVTVRMRP